MMTLILAGRLFFENCKTPMDKETFLKKLGENIGRLREEKGLSQSELARLIGRDRQMLNRIEKQGQNMTIYHLKEIADALEMKLSELMDF